MRHRTLIAMIAAIAALSPMADAAAQERLAVQGIVQWISGTDMALFADGGISLKVDLRRADQRSYNALRHNDRVLVMGVVSPARDRLVAESVTPNPDPSAMTERGPTPPRTP
jgi:hypothetical protein